MCFHSRSFFSDYLHLYSCSSLAILSSFMKSWKLPAAMNSAGKSSVTAQYHFSSWAITVHETGDTMYLITRAQLFLRWSHNVAQFEFLLSSVRYLSLTRPFSEICENITINHMPKSRYWVDTVGYIFVADNMSNFIHCDVFGRQRYGILWNNAK